MVTAESWCNAHCGSLYASLLLISRLVDDQTFGPFRPGIPTEVPLWLACYLKMARRCQIIPPDWLEPQWLTEQYRLEHEMPKSFQPMPPHYLEIATILLRAAADDIPDVERVRTCLKDLEDVRQSKIRSGLQAIQPGISHILMRNISSMELHPIRGFCVTTLNAINDVLAAGKGRKPNEIAAERLEGIRRSGPTPSTVAAAAASSSSSSSLSASSRFGASRTAPDEVKRDELDHDDDDEL